MLFYLGIFQRKVKIRIGPRIFKVNIERVMDYEMSITICRLERKSFICVINT